MVFPPPLRDSAGTGTFGGTLSDTCKGTRPSSSQVGGTGVRVQSVAVTQHIVGPLELFHNND